MDLKATIKKVKPNLADGSIKNYVIYLRKTFERCTDSPESTPPDLNFLKDTECVLATLKDMKDTTKRNYLNAIVVFTQALTPDYSDTPYFKEYSKLRDKYNRELKEKASNGKRSEKQKSNWITAEEYDNILETYKKYFSKNKISSKRSNL